MKQKHARSLFTPFDIVVYATSVAAILCAFFLFDGEGYLTLTASLIGVTSLILCAKGHPVGQLLMIVFSVLYGIISYSFAYYGEMLTYLGMTAPMACISMIAWLRHPYNGRRSEVEIRRLTPRDAGWMLLLTVTVTVLFYFILKHLGTSNLWPSTLSVATSFIAVYLTFRRSPYFALAYAVNDLVLIVLWTLAVLVHPRYTSVLVCFFVFFLNDLYGFFSWRRMAKRQKQVL